MSLTLKHMDLALERAAETLDMGGSALQQFAANWQAARAPDGLLSILAARSDLLDDLAANHLLGNSERFAAGFDALLERAELFAKNFKPVSEILLIELSLAIIGKRRALARALAKVVLNAEAGTEDASLALFQAQSLARLLDLDYSGAQAIAADLHTACETRRFNKSTHQRALHWAEAIDKLARGDGQAAAGESEQLQELHISGVDRELAKLKRGAASAFAPFDMFDLPLTALNALIEAFGYSLPAMSEAALACGYGLASDPHRQREP